MHILFVDKKILTLMRLQDKYVDFDIFQNFCGFVFLTVVVLYKFLEVKKLKVVFVVMPECCGMVWYGRKKKETNRKF